MDMYERFEQLLKENGEKTSDVARATKIAKSTFSGWKQGKFTPKKEKLELIADHFNVSVDYFYSSQMDDTLRDSINQKFKQLRTYEVSAGNGRLNDGCEYVDAPNDEESFYAAVVGDSMLPSLRDGDLVRIIPTTSVCPSDFALVRINGDELTVKHCEISEDGLWIRGENKDVFKDKFFTVQECLTIPVSIVGKAVEIVSRKL